MDGPLSFYGKQSGSGPNYNILEIVKPLPVILDNLISVTSLKSTLPDYNTLKKVINFL
jgi:hypothetical protein